MQVVSADAGRTFRNAVTNVATSTNRIKADAPQARFSSDQPRARLSGPDLSWHSRFDAAWPEVERRVRRYLSRRVSHEQIAEDATQVAAEQAMARKVDFVDAEDLSRWCVVVARHYAIDCQRKDARLLWGEIPEHTSRDDIERQVVHRALLDAVLAEYSRLPQLQREALFSDTTGDDRDVQYLRRHRARKALRTVVDRFAAAWLGLRRLAQPLENDRSVGLAVAAVAVPFAVVGLIGVINPSVGDATLSVRPVDYATHTALTRILDTPAPGPGSRAKVSTDVASPRVARRLSVDSPVEAEIVPPPAADTGLRGGVSTYDDPMPLLCLQDSVVRDVCIDYPVRP